VDRVKTALCELEVGLKPAEKVELLEVA